MLPWRSTPASCGRGSGWRPCSAQLGETASARRSTAKQPSRRTNAQPQEPEYLELIGWCEYRLGRLDDAAATFARALAIDAGWISVRFDLGLVRLLLGDGDEAAQHYRDGPRHARKTRRAHAPGR